MKSTRLIQNVDDLSSRLISLPANMRIFSLCMRSLFTDKAIGGQSQTANKFRQLRDNTRKDAVIFLNHVLPVVTRCVADIGDFFEYYQALAMDEWWESIDDIVEVAKSNEEACNVLIEILQDLIFPLKKRQNEASVLVVELTDLSTKYEKKMKDLKSSADVKNKWGLALAFVPGTNLIVCPLLFGFAQNDLAEAVAKHSILLASLVSFIKS